MTPELLLNVEDLRVRFYTLRGVVHALERVSFHLNRQETLGLAGETGCGKSVTARAILRLIDPPGRIEKPQTGCTNVSVLNKNKQTYINTNFSLILLCV